MSESPLIELTNIGKTYQMGDIEFHALADVTLNIEKGEYIAIFGPSGSGKSTLMQILGCLDTASQGTYTLNQQDVTALKRGELAALRNQYIGFVFQSFNLLDYATALENVALPLVYRNTPKKEREALAAEQLDAVGLGDRLHHKPTELSGGQCQRVAIARALVTNPEMLLADEPTGNLDSQSGEEVITLFEQLVTAGKTVITVTHDHDMAARMNRIIRVRDGRRVDNT